MDNTTLLSTKSKFRNAIFITVTLVLLPIANLLKAFTTEKMLYRFFYKYINVISYTDDNFGVTLLKNLDKSFHFLLSTLVWVIFAILGLLLVKAIYHKHILEKQVFKATLIAYSIKLGLFVVLWGGSLIARLIFPDAWIFDQIVMTQFITPYYGVDKFNTILDTVFLASLLFGFFLIYKTKIKHSVIRALGGSVASTGNT